MIIINQYRSPAIEYTFFAQGETPTGYFDNEGNVTLGLIFTTTANGFVKGIRFWRDAGNSATHIVALYPYAANNVPTTVLGQQAVTGIDTSTSGLKRQDFSSPIPVTAGTKYIACFTTNDGYSAGGVAVDTATVITRNNISWLPGNTVGGNGRFIYSSVLPSYPTDSFNNNNYWVEPVFITS